MATLATRSASHARSVAFVGLSVALMVVSAWIVVPLGPVPITLQVFVVTFVLIALSPGQAVATICCYVFMGAIGLPVFSGMRGGIGVLLGPTGGYLWGWVATALVVFGFRSVLEHAFEQYDRVNKNKPLWGDIASAVLFLLLTYMGGWMQLVLVTGMTPKAAFAAGVAPFVVVDAVKLAVAVPTARAIRNATTRR